MLYLDASAIVKRYSIEKGSRAVIARFESGERIFTSTFSFSEVHAAIARKFRSKELNAHAMAKLRDEFENDWLFSISVLDLDLRTMSALPRLVEQFDLRAGDAVHLSAAFWLNDSIRLQPRRYSPGESVEFGAADKRLIHVALECNLHIFSPEDED